jgi:peptide/nickel transport system substrate-binding protein
MLRGVGIEVQLKPYQGSLLFATLGQGGILQNGKFDLAWTGWVAGIDPDNANLYACRAKPPNGQNESRYCNPRLDTAEMQARTEYDETSRKAAYATVERTLSEEVPNVFLWWPRQLQPTNPAFEHFTPNPITASWNAYQWDI